jgi:putative FmdB family regulatory protein
MPRYEFRCKACGFTFEMRRPMSQSDAPAPCPRGHEDTVKLLSTVSVGGSSSSSPSPSASESGAGGGGGCCGGGCCS